MIFPIADLLDEQQSLTCEGKLHDPKREAVLTPHAGDVLTGKAYEAVRILGARNVSEVTHFDVETRRAKEAVNS